MSQLFSRRLLYGISLLSLIGIAIASGLFRHLLPGFPGSLFSLAELSSATVKPATTKPFPNPGADVQVATASGLQTAVLAGGCFWGMEAVFEHLKGVSDVISGYSGGEASTAQYERVGTGDTGHAESIKITYDPAQISYGQLLKIYFAVAHDPTQFNRQGPDSGTQYRSAIFFTSEQQKQVAQAYIDQLNQAHVFSQPIVTQVTPLRAFYVAESYHQDFINHNPDYPYVVIHDLPKLEQLRERFPDLYKDSSDTFERSPLP